MDDGIAGGVSMTGTDVTIECISEDGGSCNEWDITGTDPVSANPAIACVFSVFPGSAYQGDLPLGPFRIQATVNP